MVQPHFLSLENRNSKMKKKLFVVGLILGVSALLFMGKKQIDLLGKTKFKIRRVRKASMKNGVALISYDLDIFNESKIEVNLSNLKIQVFSGESLLANVTYSPTVTVSPNQSTSLPFQTSINSNALIQAIKGSIGQLIMAQTIGLSFRISVDAELLGIKVKKLTFEDTIKEFKL